MKQRRITRITCAWCGKSIGQAEIARGEELVCDWCEELPRHQRADHVEHEVTVDPKRRLRVF